MTEQKMDTLPVEIILAIGSHVSDVGGRLLLLQVCRRWRALFLEVAYNHVDIKGPQIEPLTKVILANPRIGPAIRSLSVGWWYSYIDHHPQRKNDDNLPEAAEELAGQISRSPEEQKDWIENLRAGNQEAWLALLLASVPNLTALSGEYCVHAPRVTLVVARAARKEPPFDTRPALQRLETLHITSDNMKDINPHWQFLPFFHLPSLRDVNLDAVKEVRERDRLDHPAISPALGIAPVESLVLKSYCNERNGMAQIITSCANLKEFKYQHNDTEVWSESYVDFQPRKFYRALLTQKHSLEVLHLSDNGEVTGPATDELSDDEENDGPQAYDRWFGSLAEFSYLQDLRIRVQNLLNYHDRDKDECVVLKDILPASLRSLHVAECWPKHCAVLVPNMQGVLAHHKERFANLKRIGISSGVSEDVPEGQNRFSYPRQELIPESLKKPFVPVKEMCDRAGVKFKMTLATKLESYFAYII
ncbi:hypothetical protein TSTA_106670 [Talaromyces stipitatus ATCC 10500]|uniref:Leucine-rich repeat domain-containing protein n=1 Tax=Talaromyces stipitatus (strain ATCC 10500 / CBS 375.48 / QM 6759 / NRRL 1006) TaxID=441959 RepID=B8MPL8_TALSN|nr:uncharacterized protein TSTA_106670 [Talaromyces stipitatus ATCC 10500]EED14457.1 hypothetical protein TSTA_106670 [Talaromyces stipitatus ATCC 10500]